MMHERLRPYEAVEQENISSPSEHLSDAIEAFRRENDLRLVTVMRRLDAALAERLLPYYNQSGEVPVVAEGEEPSRSHLTDIHVFQFKEGEHNRLLFVGPIPLGFGISDQSVSLTKYHASAENPRKKEAIIGQTVLVYTSEDLSLVEKLTDLEDISIAVYHLRSRTWQDREELLLEQPDVYGYVHGDNPMADDRSLLQKGVTIDGEIGLAHTRNKQEGKIVDPLTIAEELAAILEDEGTIYVDSLPMDFDPVRG